MLAPLTRKASGGLHRGVAALTKNIKFPQNKSISATTSTFYSPRPQDEDARPVSPKFWTGKSAVPYEKFQVDCGKVDWKKILNKGHGGDSWVIDPNNKEAETLRQELSEKYEQVGAVHLINSHLTTTQFNSVVRLLLPEADPIEYEGGANLRGKVEENVYDTGAPSIANIHYHNEMAYLKATPNWIAFGATEATGVLERGATFLANAVGATERMANSPEGQRLKLFDKLKEKGLCYIRKLPDQKHFQDNNLDTSIVYNYWQTSTLTDDPEEAAEVMRKKGLEVEWEDSPVFGRYMVTKFYTSAFEYNPADDCNSLYASVADDYTWFDTWPGLKDLPHWERPLKLNFGDGEVMTREEKQFWVDCLDNNGIPINWQKGDLAIICNRRWLHGRPGYQLKDGEKRELGVILGEVYEREHEREGKWK